MNRWDIPVTPLPAQGYGAYAPTVPTIGKNVRAIRVSMGLTQDEAATKCGVAQNQLSKWESGRQEPTVESLLKLAVGLGQPLEAFVSGVNRAFDLACQKRDQTSDLSQEGAQANVPAAARVELARLKSLVARYQAQARKVLQVSDSLDEVATALEEIGSADEGTAHRVRRTRKAG